MVAMSNTNQEWLDDDELDFDDYSDEPQRGSDDVLKKVRRAERAKDKQLKELQAELDSLRKFQRETTVSQVLSEKGINPKIAKFIPGDVQSPESISEWLKDNGEVFGFTVEEPRTALASEDIAALRQMESVASNAYTPDDVNDMFSILNNAQSQEELLNILYANGAE
jgi:hypothetical protein